MDIAKWMMNRVSEPSTWAAGAAVCIGVSVIVDNFWVAVAGIAVAGIAVILRERGVI
jgi:hypothetical protein